MPCIGRIHCILYHCKCAKSQEVHLEQAQLLKSGHRILGGHLAASLSGQRHVIVGILRGDQYACCMHGGVSGQSLQLHAHIYDLLYFGIRLVHAPEVVVLLQSLGECHAQLRGDHPRQLVASGIGQVHHAAYITYHALCLQGAEGDYLYALGASVFLHHIVYDLLSSFIGKVHVYIRHGYTLRVEEALEEQLISDRIYVCDMQAV